jgi:hypothetical protein
VPLAGARPAAVTRTAITTYVTSTRRCGWGARSTSTRHPEALGAVAAAALPDVFRRVAQLGLPKLTIDEVATWWKVREQAELVARLVGDPNTPELHLQRSDAAVGVLVALPIPHRIVPTGAISAASRLARFWPGSDRCAQEPQGPWVTTGRLARWATRSGIESMT